MFLRVSGLGNLIASGQDYEPLAIELALKGFGYL